MPDWLTSKTLTGLQELSLGRTRITDAGLIHLKGLANLIELTLDRTAVSDVGLLQIEGLNTLATLSLEHTKVSGRRGLTASTLNKPRS